jgi:hypothetical protein
VTITYDALDRFMDNVRVQENGCAIWIGGSRNCGTDYGGFNFRGKRYLAHRYAYEQLIGPIPEGLSLDHLCRNPRCVNPAHLEPVTHRENVVRGIGVPAVNARKTHCKRGHPFSEANTRVRLKKGRPGRECRTCIREQKRERRRAAA